MWILYSEVGKWSFFDGYNIFGNIVWLTNKEEAKKYKLINNDGEDMNVNVKDYLIEIY